MVTIHGLMREGFVIVPALKTLDAVKLPNVIRRLEILGFDFECLFQKRGTVEDEEVGIMAARQPNRFPPAAITLKTEIKNAADQQYHHNNFCGHTGIEPVTVGRKPQLSRQQRQQTYADERVGGNVQIEIYHGMNCQREQSGGGA